MALMISPLPFIGPVGAVRVGQIDGEFVINPTLQESEEQSTLDLIVVGTKEGLTMVEAGSPRRSPRTRCSRRSSRPTPRSSGSARFRRTLREQVGKAKWLDAELTDELQERFGSRFSERIPAEGLREAAAVVEEILAEEARRSR